MQGAIFSRISWSSNRQAGQYRKSGKNDGNDAEAICEAVSRPNMRFVPIKTLDQQAVLTPIDKLLIFVPGHVCEYSGTQS